MTAVPGTRTDLDVRIGRLARIAAPVLAGLVAFGLTRSTMLPGIDFWDTAEFQTVAPSLGTAHPTGYPTYTLLGWLASLVLGPAGEPAARLNVLSGLLLAVACGLTVQVVRLIGGRTLPALAAGILLSLTPWAWTIGSFADPHALHLVFVALLLLVLLAWERAVVQGEPSADRRLLAAAALFGLSLGNHQLTLLLAPGIALFLVTVDRSILRRRAFVLRCAAALFGTAGLVYLLLPLRAATGAALVYGHPDTPVGFLYVALGLQFAGDIGGPFADLPGKLGTLVGYAAAQFGVTAAVIPAAFIAVALRRPRLALLTAMWVGVTCSFAATYDNAMIERYYLGPILCVVVWLGAGAAIVVDAALILRAAPGTGGPEPSGTGEDGAPTGVPARPRRGIDWIPIRLAFITGALLVTPAVWYAPANFPGIDRRHDDRAATWSAWVMSAAEPEAVVVSWWSFSTTLWYRQIILGERPDLRVVDDRDREDEELGSVDDVISAHIGTRPVYLVRDDVDLADLATRWRLERIDDPAGIQALYRVLGPAGGAGTQAGG